MVACGLRPSWARGGGVVLSNSLVPLCISTVTPVGTWVELAQTVFVSLGIFVCLINICFLFLQPLSPPPNTQAQ